MWIQAADAAQETPPAQMFYSLSNLLYGWSESPIRPVHKEDAESENAENENREKMFCLKMLCSCPGFVIGKKKFY